MHKAAHKLALLVLVLTPVLVAGTPAGAEEPHGVLHGTENGAHAADTHEPSIGSALPLWSVIPFAGILLSIAVFPLVAPSFWHHHFPKMAAFWALAFALPFIAVYRHTAIHEILHIYIVDYIPFIILLWSLFTVSGGIVVRGSIKGTPIGNTMLIFIGTLMASWIGTTGASMVMIRPVLRANAARRYKVHVIVFFIFLVSNIGGSLTPLGDPPLFLGFLHGVPFFWTLHLLPYMSVMAVLLLSLFYVVDRYYWTKEAVPGLDAEPIEERPRESLGIAGGHNFLFLAGIVGCVLFSGMVRLAEVSVLGIHVPVQNLIRDAGMVVMGLCAFLTTPARLRKANEFSWFPIKEVAYLFAGIFMTIIPALAILRAGTEGALSFLIVAVREPWHFYWVTGALSSFLDNAPTYLTFFNTAIGSLCPGLAEPQAVLALTGQYKVYLEGIAAGAVFMGANTYIGNAPNFMVRSIAEEAGIPMPSFFGYMFKWSIPILIPSFVLISLIFF